ncbi:MULTISPECIES: Csu type fimbrial protein [Inquilinus]|uniref:Spore coat protein U-like protein n=1 Tax=Inquilinus ginsengisoli TaxID=363840 RepID=A0ABU1JZS0_9PROT|nr:spore coat U domain-containing protein [Inquilinus ginsengisoli]MDR6294121.1 spore coat protein U-like protein [Inquilinus ginsengisoli]
MRTSHLITLAGTALALVIAVAWLALPAARAQGIPTPLVPQGATQTNGLGGLPGDNRSDTGVVRSPRIAGLSALRIEITIRTACSVDQDAALAFPAWKPGDRTVDGAAAVAIDCSAGLPYLVALDAGGGATEAGRRLSAPGRGAPAMPYQLYSDPGRLSVWGDRPGIDTLPGHGTGVPVTIPVYARAVPPARGQPATYRDLVRLTVAY